MSLDAAYWINVVMLALAVWREARGEVYDAKLAVAYSVLARVAKGGWWGSDILSVLRKPLQYSSLTATGDPNLVEYPQATDPSWTDSVQAATMAISKTAPNPAPTADSYFDNSIPAPDWAKPDGFVVTIGRLNFYRTT